MTGKLAGATEENVLTLICWNERYAARVALEVPPELFSTRIFQRIAGEAVAYLEKYRTPPRAHIRDLLERELTHGENKSFFAQILDAMEKLESEIQPEYVLEQLETFIQTQRLKQAVESAADLLHDGKLEEAREALHSTTVRVKADSGTWLHDTKKWFTFLDKNEADLMSSGISALDERGVCPAKKELFLLIAAAKRGKSWYLIEVGKTAVIERQQKVVHISLENSLDITKGRYTQSFLGLTKEEVASLRIPMLKRDDLGRFTSFDFEQISPDSLDHLGKPELAKRLKPFQTKGKLYVHWFPEGTLTIPHLHAFLDSLERIEKFKPDMLIIDYANKMAVDERNFRISTGRLLSDLRGVAGMRNVAIVTATQGNRVSAGAQLVTTQHIAEDWSIVGTADTAITYSQTAEEKEIGLARIYVAAARNAKDGWISLITQSYATGQFALDSCYFSKAAETELSKMVGMEDE